jgi:hypothetical protein
MDPVSLAFAFLVQHPDLAASGAQQITRRES